jgi:streptogramin lyase
LDNNERANTKEAYQLIRFDPINREAKIYLSGANFTNSMAIDNNDNIYILDLDQSQIIKFSPKTQETTKYKVPIVLDAPPSVYLFYDRDDRLWLGDRGWFDFSSGSNPQWFNVIRSPVFINYLQSGGIWGWGRPFFTYQDENGILWFTSIRGTGWLNSEEGQWCIFTTYSSRVFEDDQQNLWLFVHGGLYTKIK